MHAGVAAVTDHVATFLVDGEIKAAYVTPEG